MTERATDATITPADVTLRRALSSDAAALAIFAARTFEEAFGAQNRPEDMAAHLATHYGPRQQAAEIADPETVVVVMESGEGLVAYAKVRRSVPPPCVADERPVELHRFYVDRRWHGRANLPRVMSIGMWCLCSTAQIVAARTMRSASPTHRIAAAVSNSAARW